MTAPDTQPRGPLSPRTFLVSRHAAAKRWLRGEAERRGWRDIVALPHLRKEHIRPGDRVAGTLPIQLAAAICTRGAEYWHLEVAVEEMDRGRELSLDELVSLGATIRRYRITPWEGE